MVAPTSSQRLEPFLLLARSARGAAAAALIRKVLGATNVYVFSELLDMPSIQDLAKNEEQKVYWELLQMFAYGTYADYKAAAGRFPQLNDAQLRKLRLLTIVSLSAAERSIGYDRLMQVLDMNNARELEDLIIDGMYSDVFRGRLDQRGRVLRIESCMGRDVRPEVVRGELLARLRAWHAQTGELVAAIDSGVTGVRQAAARSKQEAEAHERHVGTVKSQLSGPKMRDAIDRMGYEMDIDSHGGHPR
ncbi:hypothetical protein RI367_007028 [Sorochytrium milnesiophthora]